MAIQERGSPSAEVDSQKVQIEVDGWATSMGGRQGGWGQEDLWVDTGRVSMASEWAWQCLANPLIYSVCSKFHWYPCHPKTFQKWKGQSCLIPQVVLEESVPQIGAWREVPSPDLSAWQAWSCAASSPCSGLGPWGLMAGLQLLARESRKAVQGVEGRSGDWVTSFIVLTKVLCWESPGGDKAGLGSPLGSHIRVQQDSHRGHVHLSTLQPPSFPSWPLYRRISLF